MQLMEATTITSALEQGAGGGVAQHVDLFVNRRRLGDVGIRNRNIGFRLVVVVIADEVFDGIVGKNSRSSLQSCAARVLLWASTRVGLPTCG
jgi:hypothetical protein